MKDTYIIMKDMNIIKEAFQNGYTHASNSYAEQTNIESYDDSSIYENVMITKEFPLLKSVKGGQS